MAMREVSVTEYEELLGYALDNGLSIYGEGVAGIGKSTVTRRKAEEKKMEFVDLRASTIDVGDLILRMPNQAQTGMVELINQNLVRDKPYILALEEFRHADPSIRRMFYSLIWDRQLGNYHLPKGTSIIALSNPTDEVDTEDLESPLFDRFDFKVKIMFDAKEWESWAYQSGIRAEVISFLHHFGDRFMHTNVDGMPVTPRTWERVSLHVQKAEFILPAEVSVIFKEFIKKIDFFKDIDAYLEGKKEIPKAIDSQYAFASAVMSNVGDKMDDATMRKWFCEHKCKGLDDEVDVFLNAGMLSVHKTKVKMQDQNRYILGLPKELRSAMTTKYKDMGYLFDAQV